MISLNELKGKTKKEVISICRKDGYYQDNYRPIPMKYEPGNPLYESGINTRSNVAYIKLWKYEDDGETRSEYEILITDVYDGHGNLTASKLFSSEIKPHGYAVGYAWDL